MMRQKGFHVINYIDDYVWVGVLHVLRMSVASFFDLMKHLGLTISDKKLVPPSTKVVCLGVLINTEDSTVSIPPEKLHQIYDTVKEWHCRKTYTKHVYKCVKTGLCLLESHVGPAVIWPC